MFKSLTLAAILTATVAGITVTPASAAPGRTTAGQCQHLYDLSRNDSQSERGNRDAYIECVGRL
jgi:hypothetical protein